MEYCCKILKKQLTNECEQHGLECPDNLIRKYKKDFGIPYHDGSYQRIDYCPFCGRRLTPFTENKRYCVGNWLRGYFEGEFESMEEAWSWLSRRFLLSYPTDTPGGQRNVIMKVKTTTQLGEQQWLICKEGLTELNDLPKEEVLEKCGRSNHLGC